MLLYTYIYQYRPGSLQDRQKGTHTNRYIHTPLYLAHHLPHWLPVLVLLFCPAHCPCLRTLCKKSWCGYGGKYQGGLCSCSNGLIRPQDQDVTLGPCTPWLTSASNVSGFGMSQKVGHLDFFPNGGKEMPGCQKNIISTIVDINGIWEGTCAREKRMRLLPSWGWKQSVRVWPLYRWTCCLLLSWSESGISQCSKILSVFVPTSYTQALSTMRATYFVQGYTIYKPSFSLKGSQLSG